LIEKQKGETMAEEKEKKNYRVVKYIIKPKEKALFAYLYDLCVKSRNLYNVTNFYIRQVMTGMQKDKALRQPNEKEVISLIEKYIAEANIIRKKTAERKKKEAKYLKMPTSEKWFISYNLLESIFKLSNNIDYRALPAQVNQQVMRKCFADWKAYFEALKEYKICPSRFKGRPRIPNYKRGKTNGISFTNIICSLKSNDAGTYLTFPKTELVYPLGNYIPGDSTLQQVYVDYEYGNMALTLILKDRPYVPRVCEPNRIIGIDLGLDNFAAISNNIGETPILIKGKVIKERNQYFNKKKAELCSKLQKGKDSKHSEKHSRHIDSISRKRNLFFRDYFYKMGHAIIRYCKEKEIDTIIVGKNKDWKDEISLGRKSNQKFVSVPFAQFLAILSYLCLKYKIQYIETEESYTSKADFLMMDELPIYKEGENTKYKFSGRRSKRWKYISKNGDVINADVNGASNIIRKVRKTAFRDLENLNHVKRTEVWSFDHFYSIKKMYLGLNE